MSIAPSNDGFLLLDARLNLIAANDPALQILCFPSEAVRIKQPKVSLADRARTTLLACNGHDSPQPAFAVLLERDTANIHSALADISAQFGLTQREGETVEFLLQGLTSKEIGTRMNISANTVKAFLRLVMVKMKVSTRSGIAGKIAGSRAGCSPVILQPIKPIEAGVENHRREYLEMR